MAYAAVLSLSQTLEQISNPHPGPEQYKTPLQDQQIKSLQEKFSFLLDFLDDSWQRRSEELRCLEIEIRDAAYKVEDMIDWYTSLNFGQGGFLKRLLRLITDKMFQICMKRVADAFDSIKTKAAKLKEPWGATDMHQSQKTSLPTGPSRLTSSGKHAMIGFQDDLNQIMDRLTRYPPALTIIPVIGMGGIGKTTLAKNAYGHPRISLHFDTRAWVSISQEYCEREVLLSLLDSMKQLSDEMRQKNDTEQLKEYLYKSLKGRRYLVVLDDVWNSEALDSLRRLLPDDGMGSRIMLTSRLSSVVDSHSSPHQMQFLNETDSWNLLCQKVFGEDCCPLELEEAGKEIAENCRGLPLSLVVMGGHLSKAIRTKDYWEYVAQDVKSVVTATDANCSEILSISYDYLPHYLKACFLYMGIFPEDDKISVSKLIKLWVAEGFLKPVIGKTLEEVAEEYLGDLISRNLILIRERSSRGKIKSCSIHDLLRDLCIRKAQEEKFFHVTDKAVNIFDEGIKYSRRLCSHTDISNVNPSMGYFPPVRSVLCSGFAGEIGLYPLLRVFFLSPGKVDGFPIGETKLVHLRCLFFSCRGKISIPKTLPDFCWYLQTLIIDSREVHLPKEIWRMPQLRHLLCVLCYLPCPARSPIDGETLVLENLLTLSKVSSSCCTEELFERVPNLNKLGIFAEPIVSTPFSLGNLPQLENLKIINEYKHVSVPMNITFPPNIRKLTLERCNIPWKHMTIVGSMPKLEVLKLRHKAFEGPEWEPTEGEFCKLKYLLLYDIDLVQWRADNTHFTSLECLVLRKCFKLEEIPCSIGDIPTLQIIDLDDASPSAVTSAKLIQEELGNDSLHVSVLDVFHSTRLLIKDRDAELIAKFLSSDNKLQQEATTLFRKIFSDESISPTEEILSGSIPRLLEFLDRDDYPQLQCEAAFTIKSISYNSSDIINMLIDHGAIPILVSLLSSPNHDDLREKALELLGNFALDSTKSRDHVLSYGVLTPLLTQLNDKTKLSIMRMAALTLSKLCWGYPQPEFEQFKPFLLPLVHLIHEDDAEVLSYACTVLSTLFTAKTEDMIQVAIDAGVFPRLVELLQYRSPRVWYPALCCVRSIISSVDDSEIQVITNNRVLLYLHNLLTQDYGDNAKVETIMIISKIIERTEDKIQALIEVGIISSIVHLLQNAEFDLQIMAAWAIVNAMVEGTNELTKFLVHEGCIKPMCDLLFSPNPDEVITIKNCLVGLENILKVGEAEKNTDDVNVFAQMIDDAGGLQKIKNLLTHDNSRVSELAMKILQTYWLKEDDNNNEDSEDEDDNDNDEDSKDEDEEDEENDNENFLCFLLKILSHLWCTLMDRSR